MDQSSHQQRDPAHDTEQSQPMTYDQYLQLIAQDIHAEWVKGRVTIFNAPTTSHRMVQMFFSSLLNDFVSFFNLGVVIPAPFEMVLYAGNVSRQPDILFVSRANMDNLDFDRLQGGADLVVEIVSESSANRDYRGKYYEYQHAGVKEYWIVDPRPDKHYVYVYRLDPTGRYQSLMPDRHSRYHSRVLPGFWVNTTWLWQGMLPDARRALSEIAPDTLR
jgi:Uma2 family endonuclease